MRWVTFCKSPFPFIDHIGTLYSSATSSVIGIWLSEANPDLSFVKVLSLKERIIDSYSSVKLIKEETLLPCSKMGKLQWPFLECVLLDRVNFQDCFFQLQISLNLQIHFFFFFFPFKKTFAFISLPLQILTDLETLIQTMHWWMDSMFPL